MRQRRYTNKYVSDDRPENDDASSVAMLLLPKFLSKHVRIGGRHNGNQRNESSRHMQCVHSAASYNVSHVSIVMVIGYNVTLWNCEIHDAKQV